MSLLQFLIIVSGFIFILMAIDAYQRKRFNLLHFLIFFGWTWILILFALNIELLNRFWKFFGVTRGADLIVYISIIVLFRFYFELLNSLTKDKLSFSKFISNEAIDNLLDYRKDLWEQFWNEIYDKLKKIPNDEKKYFLFLIRAYNEEKTIWRVIDDIFNFWFSKIIVINDWSVDKTLEILKRKQEEYKDKVLIVLSHLVNRWGWAANKTGFKFLKIFWDKLDIKRVVTFDADWQMDIKDMDKFVENISICQNNNFKIVFLWSRFVKWGWAENIPFLRKIILLWSRIITYFFNWLRVSDPHNWYRVLPLEFVKQVNIQSDWMTYASELLEEIKRLNYKIVEVPVNIKYTDYSLSKWQKNSNAIKILVELIYKKFFYK